MKHDYLIIKSDGKASKRLIVNGQLKVKLKEMLEMLEMLEKISISNN